MRALKRHGARLTVAAIAAAVLVAGHPAREPADAAVEVAFTFTAAGDHGTGSQPDASMYTVATSGSSFYLALGDLSYDSTDGGEQRWCGSFKSRFADVEVLAGNHDTGESTGGSIDEYVLHCPFTLGQFVGDYGKQYFFDYPQAAPLARFIMIAPGVRGSLNIDYSATGPGYAFTRDAIDSARAAGIKWIVVGMHKNCISVGDKACEIGTALMNLLIEKRVDLVLQSHDHNYQRSHALSCVTVGSVNPDCIADDGSDGLYAKGAGPVVLINGEFGRPLYPVNPSDSEAGYFAKSDATTFGITRYHVTETSITADYIGSGGGTNADSFTIAEIVGAPPPSRTTLSVVPSDDAMIVAASATTNFGSGTSLGVDSSPVEHSLMKFDVTGIGSRRVVSAKLRVRSTNGSNRGGDFRAAATSWSEGTVTWQSSPPAGALVTSVGSIVSGQYYDIDLTSLVTGDGSFGIRVDTPSGDGAGYASSESSTGAYRPRLLVTVEGITTLDTEPPSSPGTLNAVAPMHDRVELAWAAATDDRGVHHYTIRRDGAVIATTHNLAHIDTGRSANTAYAYEVTASDAAGNEGPPSSAFVTTPSPPPPPPPTTTLLFGASADTTVKESFPNSTYGTSKALDVDAGPAESVLLKFAVSGVGGRDVTAAKLRLYVRNASTRGGNVRRAANTSWSEATATWSNAPLGEGLALSALGAVAANSWIEADVTGAVGGDGTFTFRIDAASTDGAGYSSKESAMNRPQLVVTVVQ
jgi:chitodextrinase